jgi:hypothetical protein
MNVATRQVMLFLFPKKDDILINPALWIETKCVKIINSNKISEISANAVSK